MERRNQMERFTVFKRLSREVCIAAVRFKPTRHYILVSQSLAINEPLTSRPPSTFCLTSRKRRAFFAALFARSVRAEVCEIRSQRTSQPFGTLTIVRRNRISSNAYWQIAKKKKKLRFKTQIFYLPRHRLVDR